MNAGQGWEGREDRLQLAGWQQSRRVALLRRLLKEDLITTREQQGQLAFAFVDRRRTKVYEYVVLVTDLQEGILSIAQLYRDRADAENGFDELKNQWGWGGYTTRDLARCRLSARAVGLVSNWWSWYSAGLSRIPQGGYYQPPAAPGRHWSKHKIRRTDLSVSDSHPCCAGAIGARNRQYPQRVADHSADCGAVAWMQRMEPARELFVAQVTRSPWSPPETFSAITGP